MFNDSINHEYIIRYIRGLSDDRDGLLGNIRSYAKNCSIPVIEPETAAFLKFLCLAKNPGSILEIGSAVGYSAILMAKSSGADVVTVERDENLAKKARENITAADLSGKIRLIEGEAADVLSGIKEKFDMIFIDAAKGGYPEFFAGCKNMLNDKGIIVFDNVLYRGMTASDELVVRRKITIVKRLRRFISSLAEDRELAVSVLPLGDGLLLVTKGKV